MVSSAIGFLVVFGRKNIISIVWLDVKGKPNLILSLSLFLLMGMPSFSMNLYVEFDQYYYFVLVCMAFHIILLVGPHSWADGHSLCRISICFYSWEGIYITGHFFVILSCFLWFSSSPDSTLAFHLTGVFVVMLDGLLLVRQNND